jgi:hypothetical protein
VLFCVICVFCVLCLIVVPLSPGKNPFEVQVNNNNNNESPRLIAKFCNRLIFYGEDFLAPHPIHKLEDQRLLAFHGSSLTLFVVTLHSWRPSPPSAT